MGTERVEGVYEGDSADHVVGPMLDGRTERIPQGTVSYDEWPSKTWPMDAIEPIEDDAQDGEAAADGPESANPDS